MTLTEAIPQARLGESDEIVRMVAFLSDLFSYTTTPTEAEAIRPWVAHSPFLSWIYRVATVQGGSILIGSLEITTALLIALRRWLPKATVVGSLVAAGMFLITLSFLVTTPNQSPDAQGFLMKDFFLLGAAIWSAGEALQATARDSET